MRERMIEKERSEQMDEWKTGYSSYDHDRLEAADKMKIERGIYFETKNADISPLTALPLIQRLRQSKTKLNVCRFIRAAERGHKHFFVGLCGILDIVKSLV